MYNNHLVETYRQPAFKYYDDCSPLADCFRKMSIYEAEYDQKINAEHGMTEKFQQEPIL